MTNTLLIMDWVGDTRVEYSTRNPMGRAVAKAAFDAAKQSGYVAYTHSVDGGDQGTMIGEFDPSVERIVMMVPAFVGDRRGLHTP